MWQDWLFSINNLICIFALLPMLRSPEKKPPLSTGVLSVCLCISGTVGLASLGCTFAAACTCIVCIEWIIATRQRYLLDGKPSLAKLWQQAKQSLRFA